MKATDLAKQPKLAVIPHIQDKTEQLSHEDLELKQRNLTLYNDVGPASQTEAFGRYELHQDIVKQRTSSVPAPSSAAKSSGPRLSEPLIVAGLHPISILGGAHWRKIIVGCSLLGALGGLVLGLTQKPPSPGVLGPSVKGTQLQAPPVAMPQAVEAADAPSIEPSIIRAPKAPDAPNALSGNLSAKPPSTQPSSARPTNTLQLRQRKTTKVQATGSESVPTKPASPSADLEANETKKNASWKRGADTVGYGGESFPVKVKNHE